MPYDDASEDLFTHFYNLQELSNCPHLHQDESRVYLKLYDLLGVREYLIKMGQGDGDLLDAFAHEHENFSREGYWHEFEVRNCCFAFCSRIFFKFFSFKSHYLREENIERSEEILTTRKDLLNYRR